MMAEELEKGQKTLAAMAESRAQLKNTGDEYAGAQRSALGSGGRLLTKLERQAVTERIVLWVGFACFLLAAVHVIFKRTPVLVRFHPLYYIDTPRLRRQRKPQPPRAAAAEAKAAAKAGGSDGAGAAAAGLLLLLLAAAAALSASASSAAAAAMDMDVEWTPRGPRRGRLPRGRER